MKDKNSNLENPVASKIWVDNGWSGIADLIDKMSGKAEVKTWFFYEGIEISKKMPAKCIPWQLHDGKESKFV